MIEHFAFSSPSLVTIPAIILVVAVVPIVILVGFIPFLLSVIRGNIPIKKLLVIALPNILVLALYLFFGRIEFIYFAWMLVAAPFQTALFSGFLAKEFAANKKFHLFMSIAEKLLKVISAIGVLFIALFAYGLLSE